MCEEYVIDALDPQTLIVKRDFIDCMRKLGIELEAREWGDYYVVDISELEPSKREKLAPLALRLMNKSKVSLKQEKQQPQQKIVHIKIEWDLSRLFQTSPRRRGYRRVISVYLADEVIQKIDEIAKKHGLNRSELVARVLEAFLDAYSSNK